MSINKHNLEEVLNHAYSLFTKEQLTELVNNKELRRGTIKKLKEQYDYLRSLDVFLDIRYNK